MEKCSVGEVVGVGLLNDTWGLRWKPSRRKFVASFPTVCTLCLSKDDAVLGVVVKNDCVGKAVDVSLLNET